MPSYKAPLRDQQFVLHEVLGAVDALRQMPRYAELDADTVNQVIEEAGWGDYVYTNDMTLSRVFRINRSGDEEGCIYDAKSRTVNTPRGFKEAYDAFREAGWQGLAAETEYGGQGLPHLLQIAFYEMQYSTNQAWAMYPGLTIGAYECLLKHASDDQKELFLPKLASGQWTGTMCLTEPHCGTSSPTASTTWRRTSCTWCWRACRTRRTGRKESRYSSCRSSCPPEQARAQRSAHATGCTAVASSTRWAFTAMPPAR